MRALLRFCVFVCVLLRFLLGAPGVTRVFRKLWEFLLRGGVFDGEGVFFAVAYYTI